MNKQTVLYGNGFNYLLDGYPSWGEITKCSDRTIDPKDIPFTVQFEIKTLKDNPDDVLDKETQLKEQLQDRIKNTTKQIIEANPEELSLYKKLIDMRFDNYLSTNYDNILYRYLQKASKSLAPQWKFVDSDRTEDNYSIRRHYKFKIGDNYSYLWNIHGDVDRKSSMLIGYNHYCGSLWKINNYVKGQYFYKVKDNTEEQKNSPIQSRLLDKTIYKDEQKLRSWIDTFFTNDIHIIGLGLPFDEIDLWWLLNYRIRQVKSRNNRLEIKNNIYYYCVDIDEHKELALKSFGVQIVKPDAGVIQTENDPDTGNDKITNYYDIYIHLLNKMENNMVR